MGKESSCLWASLKRGVGGTPGLHMERIENGSVNKGTPDVELCLRGRCAWVELKYLEGAPKKPSTPVRIPHFTAEQKLWLRKRGICGGLAWLFVQVGGANPQDTEYFLFDHEAAQVVTELTIAEWRTWANWHWVDKCDWTVWLNLVTGIYRRESNGTK